MIIDRPINRLFTFGCSFTKYFWSCWPEIVAEDLGVPFYNYGKSGAGNQFIANMIVQADRKYKFTTDDLVMVCWTNVCREDKWRDGEWATPGNIYTQNIYSNDYVEKWADPLGYLVRDCATISSIKGYLENLKCQHHFFSMCDIHFTLDQGEKNTFNQNLKTVYDEICDSYKDIITLPSFYNLLWHNDIHLHKFKPQKEVYENYFDDGHPNPLDHFNFLKRLFPYHEFKETTIEKVKKSNDILTAFVLDQIKIKKKRFGIYELDPELLRLMANNSQIKKSEIYKII